MAFVAQDGVSVDTVPWESISAVFIGGTTGFKLGPMAVAVASEARRRGKWVHVGRVNSRKRARFAMDIGADSIDGSQFSWFADVKLRPFLDWLKVEQRQGTMFK